MKISLGKALISMVMSGSAFIILMAFLGKIPLGSNDAIIHVFKDEEQCLRVKEKSKLDIDCYQLSAVSEELADDYSWNFKDGAECAINYGAHSCVKSSNGFSLRPLGFMYSNYQVKRIAPVYHAKDFGYVTPNGYPVGLGENKFSNPYDRGNIGNLFVPFGLHEIGCYETRGKFSKTHCATKRILMKLNSRYKRNILSEYGKGLQQEGRLSKRNIEWHQ